MSIRSLALSFLVPIILVLVIAAVIARYFIDPPVETVHRVTDLIPQAEKPENRSAIIFVHGIAGHFLNTWKHPQVEQSWFELLKSDPRFATFNVHSIGYDSHRPAPLLPDIIDRLETKLRQFLTDYEELYFVAHSLGGIVTQKLLLRFLVPGPQERSMVDSRIKLVLFLATPGVADWKAGYIELAAQNPLWGYLASDEFVTTTVDDWRRILWDSDHLEAVCAAERLPMRGILKVVSEESARNSCARRYSPTSIYATHVTIAKPRACSEEQYDWVATEILGTAKAVRRNALFPQRPRECQPSLGAGNARATALLIPFALYSIFDAPLVEAAEPYLKDLESLQRALYEGRNPHHVSMLTDYFKPGHPEATRAAEVVAGLLKSRRDPKVDSDFYRSLSRVMRDASLTVATPFKGINFAAADFSDLDLRYVDFTGANLTRANFVGANLERANLTKTCLTKAKFVSGDRWAWLHGADFAAADLTNADIVWKEKRLPRQAEVTIGLSVAASLDKTILSVGDPTLPKDEVARRGAVLARFAPFSPCLIMQQDAPFPLDLPNIYFDSDQSDLRRDVVAFLDEVVGWLKTNPRYFVLVEGHAAERGTSEYNLALGERRATTVVNYLTSRGVSANQAKIISYGGERPICNEKTDDCQAKNRRVALLVKSF